MVYPLHIPSCALQWEEELPAAVPQPLALPSVSIVGRMIVFSLLLVFCSNSCSALACPHGVHAASIEGRKRQGMSVMPRVSPVVEMKMKRGARGKYCRSEPRK